VLAILPSVYRAIAGSFPEGYEITAVGTILNVDHVLNVFGPGNTVFALRRDDYEVVRPVSFMVSPFEIQVYNSCCVLIWEKKYSAGPRDGGEEMAVDQARDLIAAVRAGDACFYVKNRSSFGKALGAGAIPYLMEALDDEKAFVRRAAIDALLALHAAESVEKVSVLLSDPHYRVRESALAMIAEMKPTNMSALIAPLLFDRDSAFARMYAADLLGFHGDITVLEPLKAAARDENEFVARAASTGLEKLAERGIHDGGRIEELEDHFLRLPKKDLHCHVSPSIAPEFVAESIVRYQEACKAVLHDEAALRTLRTAVSDTNGKISVAEGVISYLYITVTATGTIRKLRGDC
jgi:hypothetical protein